jgi:lipopolysaccharide export system protein LptA
MRAIYLLLIFFTIANISYAQESKKEELSGLLGGIVQSDSWIIRKEKNEEEFIGNVHYENDMYKITADRAVSRRKEQSYTLEGNVYASRSDKKTGKAEIKAQKIFYNKLQDYGYALAPKNKQISLFYNTEENKYKLYGNKLDFSGNFNNFKITGNGKFYDINNKLYVQQMIFNRESGVFETQGGRPVLSGFNDDGNYALQADKITAFTTERKYKAEGKVRGWVTSNKNVSSAEFLK